MVLTRQQQLLSKIETSEGIYTAMTETADGLFVFDPGISDNVDRIERNQAAANIGRRSDIPGRRSRQVTFTQDWVGSGSSPTGLVEGEVTVSAGGSGYSAGATLTLTGGTSTTAATLTVISVDGSGAVLRARVLTPGSYTVEPGNPVSVVEAGGATFTVTWATLVPPWDRHVRACGFARKRPRIFTVEDLTEYATVLTIQDAGSGYSVDDILTFTGGTSTTTAQARVTSVGGGGEVQSVAIETAGVYTVTPSNPVSSTAAPPGGTLCTLNVTWAVEGFKPGEKIYKSGAEATNYGIVLSGAAVSSDTQAIVVQMLAGADWVAADVLVGSKTGAKGDVAASPAPADDHYCYQPATEKTIRLYLATWSVASPSISDGDVIAVYRVAGGREEILSAIRVVDDVSSGGDWTAVDAVLLWGQIASGDTLVHTSAATTTVLSAPVQVDIPSLSFQHKVGTYTRQSSGNRGNFTLGGEAGGVPQLQFTFDGLIVNQLDAALVEQSIAGQKIPTRIVAPLGGQITAMTVSISTGQRHEAIGCRTIEIDPGNTVALRADANGPGGDRVAEVTDRDPRIRLTVDNIQQFPIAYQLLQQVGTTVAFMFRLNAGTTQGVLTVHAPFCQIVDVSDEDSDGIAGFAVELAPRFWDDGVIVESGRNELFIAQTSI